MSTKSSAKYDEDAPSLEEQQEGFKAAKEAFLKNRNAPPEVKNRAIKRALKRVHKMKEK